MHQLAVKNQQDALTQAEQTELASYLRVGYHGDFVDGYTANGADILLSLSW